MTDPVNLLSIHSPDDSRLLLAIHPDGTMEIGPDAKPTEDAKALLAALEPLLKGAFYSIPTVSAKDHYSPLAEALREFIPSYYQPSHPQAPLFDRAKALLADYA